jgi:hypothetical protein
MNRIPETSTLISLIGCLLEHLQEDDRKYPDAHSPDCVETSECQRCLDMNQATEVAGLYERETDTVSFESLEIGDLFRIPFHEMVCFKKSEHSYLYESQWDQTRSNPTFRIMAKKGMEVVKVEGKSMAFTHGLVSKYKPNKGD